jgi:site-specific recombinase XerD
MISEKIPKAEGLVSAAHKTFHTEKKLDYVTVREKIGRINNFEHKAMFAVMYGTACRSAELVKIEKKGVWQQENALIVQVPTAKNRKHPFRNVPISMAEEWLVRPIVDFVNVCSREVLFPYSTRWIRMLARKYFGVNSHILRHSRLSHLVEHYSYNEFELQLVAGWSNAKPAKVYVHLDWRSLLRKMQANSINAYAK